MVLAGSRWPRHQLTYKISDYPDNDISQSQTLTEIQRAFAVWSDVTPLRFERRSSGRADIDIAFKTRAHGDGNPFDGPGRTLAHAFFPQFGGDAHLDDEETWTVRSYRGEYRTRPTRSCSGEYRTHPTRSYRGVYRTHPTRSYRGEYRTHPTRSYRSECQRQFASIAQNSLLLASKPELQFNKFPCFTYLQQYALLLFPTSHVVWYCYTSYILNFELRTHVVVRVPNTSERL